MEKAAKFRFADRALPKGGRREGGMGLMEASKNTAEHWVWVLGGSTAQAVGTVELAPKESSAGSGHAGPFQGSVQREEH